MNLTEAAKIVTDKIADHLGEYLEADGVRDFAVLDAIYADVNSNLDRPIHAQHIDALFAELAEADAANDEAQMYANTHPSGSTLADHYTDQSDEVTRSYCRELTFQLRQAGYEGEDYIEDTYAELLTH